MVVGSFYSDLIVKILQSQFNDYRDNYDEFRYGESLLDDKRSVKDYAKCLLAKCGWRVINVVRTNFCSENSSVLDA